MLVSLSYYYLHQFRNEQKGYYAGHLDAATDFAMAFPELPRDPSSFDMFNGLAFEPLSPVQDQKSTQKLNSVATLTRTNPSQAHLIDR